MIIQMNYDEVLKRHPIEVARIASKLKKCKKYRSIPLEDFVWSYRSSDGCFWEVFLKYFPDYPVDDLIAAKIKNTNVWLNITIKNGKTFHLGTIVRDTPQEIIDNITFSVREMKGI